jgi:hypothetical protein
MPAAHLRLGLSGMDLPKRINFQKTLGLCIEKQVINSEDADDLRRLMEL